MEKIFDRKMDKKGISVMIGYVLLVVFAVIIGAIVFQWVRTFVPAQALECPEGTSISVTSATFNSTESKLSLTLKNDGRFGISGYFIYGTNESDGSLPAVALSKYFSSGGGYDSGSSIIFLGDGDNPFFPDSDPVTHVFEINQTELSGEIHSISVLPIRDQEAGGRPRSVSCGNARTEVPVTIMAGIIIFISGHTRTYKGGFGGISKADSECNDMASDAELEGYFVAWLSDENIDAGDRISEGSYVLVDGTKIAGNKSELLSGSILNPINLNQIGDKQSGKAWTGTDEFGVSTGEHCDNWSSNSTSTKGTRGDLDKKDFEWTNFNTDGCNEETRIYCFQLE